MTVFFNRKGFVFEMIFFDKHGIIIELENYNTKTKIRTPITNVNKSLVETGFIHNIDIENIIYKYCKRYKIDDKFEYMYQNHNELILDDCHFITSDEEYIKMTEILEGQIELQHHPLSYIPSDIEFHTDGNGWELNEVLSAIIILSKRYNYKTEIEIQTGNHQKKSKIVTCEPKLKDLVDKIITVYKPQGGFYYKNKIGRQEEGDSEEFCFVGKSFSIDSRTAQQVFSSEDTFTRARERVFLKQYLKEKLKHCGFDNKEVDKVFTSV